jgi:hypothetical protein
MGESFFALQNKMKPMFPLLPKSLLTVLQVTFHKGNDIIKELNAKRAEAVAVAAQEISPGHTKVLILAWP